MAPTVADTVPNPAMRMLRFGALCWLLAVQFFVTQAMVALAWPRPYSLRARFISDLGNTACAPYPDSSSAMVCSPWHAAMNTSFIVLGLTMGAGAILARDGFRAGWRRSLAIALFIAAGAGVAMVGI